MNQRLFLRHRYFRPFIIGTSLLALAACDAVAAPKAPILREKSSSVPRGSIPSPASTPTIAGTVYYIDSTAGHDSNSGTTPTEPWQTISKVQAALNAGGIVPGTAFLFKSGSKWIASSAGEPMLDLPSGLNGTSSRPILFGRYSSGPLPLFDGNRGKATACFFANGGSGASPYISDLTIADIECRDTSLYGIYFHQYNRSGGMPGIIVENMNIHNTGPGAFTSATTRNSCGAVPCDDDSYRNQLMFLDEAYFPDDTKFLSNVVDMCGGHNCIQIQGDTGGPLIQGNTCYSWVHNCIDVKQSIGALVKDNTVWGGTAAGGAAYYYENDRSPNDGSITWQENLAYSVPNGIECENGTPREHRALCKAYNNTLYLGNQSAIVSASTAGLTWDVRNNIVDTTDPIFVCNTDNSNSCGEITTWDYNDDGGSQGKVSIAVTGPHDLIGVNPGYVDAAAANFHLPPGSRCIAAGEPGLTAGNNNIGRH